MIQRSVARGIATAIAASVLLLQGCSLVLLQPAQSVASLAARIQRYIEQPRFSAAQWGIKVVSLDTGRTVFEHNADKYFIPASNTKLYTGALVLDTFTPDTRILTGLYATAPINEKGVLNGDLVLYGQGDPTFGSAEETGAVQNPLDALAAQLVPTGLKRVRGRLIVDDRYFASPPIGTGWQTDDLQWSYGAKVSAFTIQENAFTLTIAPAAHIGWPCEIIQEAALIKRGKEGVMPSPVKIVNRTFTTVADAARGIRLYREPGSDTLYVSGSLALTDAPQQRVLALPDPAKRIGHALRTALTKYQIAIENEPQVVHWLDRDAQDIPAHWIPLVQLESPPLAELLKQMLKRSQNLYAQNLFLHVGRHTSEITSVPACAHQGPICTTEQWGVYALNTFLAQTGIAGVQIHEGSGLARSNLVTPAATVALLKYMDSHPAAQVFKNGLPVAGVDGTLENRMKGTAAQNNVQAKTGTLQYIDTLSGYVITAAGERLAFSIMLNNYAPPRLDSEAVSTPFPKDDIDAIVVQCAEFLGHS